MHQRSFSGNEFPFAFKGESFSAQSKEDIYREAVCRHLSQMYLFRDVRWSDLESLVELCPIQHYRVGETIMRQGASAEGAMILIEGKLRVSLEGKSPQFVGEVYPGEIFGEQGLFHTRGERNATVTTVQNSICLKISPQLMREESHNSALSALERQLIAALARRIRRTNIGLQRTWKEADGVGHLDTSGNVVSLVFEQFAKLLGGKS